MSEYFNRGDREAFRRLFAPATSETAFSSLVAFGGRGDRQASRWIPESA
jgi:hypothetical protein